MVDAVTSNYVFKGTRKASIKLTNISDGTGEASVVKVDLSTLVGPDGTPPTKISIESIESSIGGFSSVQMHFSHTTPDIFANLGAGYSYFDWKDEGGFVDPASAGGTGDIVLTTSGATATATYDITINFRLKD